MSDVNRTVTEQATTEARMVTLATSRQPRKYMDSLPRRGSFSGITDSRVSVVITVRIGGKGLGELRR